MLSDAAIRRLKGREKSYKVADAYGLHILVKPNGSRLWRYKYRFQNKEKLLAIGAYPDVSLARARELRDAAKAEMKAGIDPSTAKRLKAYQLERRLTLGEFTEQWLDTVEAAWTPRHKQAVKGRLEKYVLPMLGSVHIDDITPPLLLECLRQAERISSSETVRRIRQHLSALYAVGIASGITGHNPALQIRGALKPVIPGRQPAIIDLTSFREMIEKIEAFPSQPTVKLAMRFLALTATRSNEVRGMRWAEIRGDEWIIPATRTKMKREFVVPLSRQAREILDVIKPISGRFDLVFPSPRWSHKALSDNTLSIILRRTGYEGRHVPHGFRASFSSIMNEHNPGDRAVIDLMLAHLPRDTVEAAYNRALHMPRRRELAQAWADLILEGRPSAGLLISADMEG